MLQELHLLMSLESMSMSTGLCKLNTGHDLSDMQDNSKFLGSCDLKPCASSAVWRRGPPITETYCLCAHHWVLASYNHGPCFLLLYIQEMGTMQTLQLCFLQLVGHSCIQTQQCTAATFHRHVVIVCHSPLVVIKDKRDTGNTSGQRYCPCV